MNRLLPCLALLAPLAAHAAEPDPGPGEPVMSGPGAAPAEPAGDGDFGILALPFAFFTPETRTGGGAAVLVHFRVPGWNGALASTVRAVGMYTQNEQAIAEVEPDVYFSGGDRVVEIYARGENYPDAYWGVGARTRAGDREVYTARGMRLRALGLQAVLGHAYAGAMVDVQRTEIHGATPGGEIARGDAEAARGGRFVGVGPVLRWDTRNSNFLPSHGAYAEASALAFAPELGSTRAFGKLALDLRGFLDPGAGHVLAGHVQLEAAGGNVPFQMLPLFGGGRDLRGYVRGRFRDRILATAQAEWRLPVWGMLGAAVFGGLGTVAPRVELADVRVLPSVGAGARLVFGKREPISARLDLAYGADGMAVYALAGEAF